MHVLIELPSEAASRMSALRCPGRGRICAEATADSVHLINDAAIRVSQCCAPLLCRRWRRSKAVSW